MNEEAIARAQAQVIRDSSRRRYLHEKRNTQREKRNTQREMTDAEIEADDAARNKVDMPRDGS